MEPIKFHPSSSKILQERQQEKIDNYKAKTIDEIVEKIRVLLLKEMKENNEIDIDEKIKQFLQQEGPNMTFSQQEEISKEILDELRGYGPLADLINDPYISDIIVVHTGRIVYEKLGELYTHKDKSGNPTRFRTSSQLRLLIERLCIMGFARVDESEPISVFNAGGMRITVTIPPISATNDGEPMIAIRKFVSVPTLDDLIKSGSLSPDAAEFMRALSIGSRNIAFVGGMGTGKTTMIATMAKYFREEELPILVEVVRECPMEHPNLRILVARPPNIEGKGEVNLSRLIRTALTMKASRVLVSEAKGGEFFDVLQACNIGHDGTMLTFHANSAVDAVYKRMPSMLMMSPEIPEGYDPSILIGNSLHFICMMEQVKGQRRFREITELDYDYETGKAVIKPVFKREGDRLVATGHVPHEKLEDMTRHNVNVSPEIFKNKVFF